MRRKEQEQHAKYCRQRIPGKPEVVTEGSQTLCIGPLCFLLSGSIYVFDLSTLKLIMLHIVGQQTQSYYYYIPVEYSYQQFAGDRSANGFPGSLVFFKTRRSRAEGTTTTMYEDVYSVHSAGDDFCRIPCNNAMGYHGRSCDTVDVRPEFREIPWDEAQHNG